MKGVILNIFIFISIFIKSNYSISSVQLDTTRVIYHEGDKNTSLKLFNVGDDDLLIESWIDEGDFNASINNANAPFIINPPVFRLNGHQQKNLLIFYVGDELPKDRETLFWLNVLEIPQDPKEKIFLQFATRTRIKLFYRPRGLSNDIKEQTKNIDWSLIKKNGEYFLRGINKGPYYLSFNKMRLDGFYVIGGMIPPYDFYDFHIEEKFICNNEMNFMYQSISDYGLTSYEKMFINCKLQ